MAHGAFSPRRARLTKVSLCLLHAVDFTCAGAFRIYDPHRFAVRLLAPTSHKRVSEAYGFEALKDGGAFTLI